MFVNLSTHYRFEITFAYKYLKKKKELRNMLYIPSISDSISSRGSVSVMLGTLGARKKNLYNYLSFTTKEYV